MRPRTRVALVLLLDVLSSRAARADSVVTACATDTQAGAGTNLAQALAAGGVVRFECPPGTSITVSGRYTLAAGATIDGGDAIAFDGKGAEGPFLSATGNVALRRMVVRGFIRPPVGPLGQPHSVLDAAGDAELDHVTVEANDSPIEVRGKAIVTGSTFADNRGWALFVGVDGVAEVSRSRFTGNELALVLNAGQVRDSTFSGQTQHAVRIAAPRGAVEVRHSVFTENRGGAALLLSQQSGNTAAGKVSVRACTFRDNEGGALGVFDMVQEARNLGFPATVVDGLSHLPPAGFVTSYNRFEKNRGGRGGAIDADLTRTSGLVSTADLFIGNTASGDGGAVAVTGGQMQVTHALFAGNEAAGRGAALVVAAAGRVAIANSLVIRNIGPAGALAGGALALTNVTVADNESAGLILEGGAGRVSNTILAHNRPSNCAQVAAAAFHGNNSVSDPTCPGVPASDAFLDTFYVPAPGSPALVAGDLAVCRAAPVDGVDLPFQGRPGSTRCALGAFERAPVRQLARAVDHGEPHAAAADDFSDDEGYRPPPPRKAPAGRPPASETLRALREAGIDFSVPEDDLLDWLGNPRFTPYPSIVSVIFRLLEGKRLRRPVFIDVIVWNYEHAPGVASPRNARNVDVRVLKAAMLEGFNERHGTSERDFQGIVR